MAPETNHGRWTLFNTGSTIMEFHALVDISRIAGNLGDKGRKRSDNLVPSYSKTEDPGSRIRGRKEYISSTGLEKR
jgi:hypothetical protein